MDKINLTNEQKDRILKLCIYTGMSYKKIAKTANIPIKQLYEMLNQYCKENNYEGFIRTRKGVIFKTKEGEKVEKITKESINKNNIKRNLQEIEEWCKKNKRMPRREINGIYPVLKGEVETEEQREMRLGKTLNFITTSIVKKYEDKNLEEIENEDDREIVRIMREVKKTYRDNNRKHKSLKNAQEIEEWCKKNKRMPRSSINGINTALKGEVETEEQKEMRLGNALSFITTSIVKKYTDKNLEEIENEDDREIVRIMREVRKTYRDNRKHNGIKEFPNLEVQNNDINGKLFKAIINVLKTRKATVEQIKIMAEYYGIDLEKTWYYPEKMHNSENRDSKKIQNEGEIMEI